MKLISIQELYLLSVIAVIRLANRSGSVRLRLLFTKTVAFLAYFLSRRKRRLSEKNVFKAFEGQLSKKRGRAIVKGSFYEFWLDAISLPYCKSSEAARRPIRITGLEHLQDSLKRRNGAILWESSYFGRRNLAKHILYRNGFAIDQVHAYGHIGGFHVAKNNQSSVIERIIRPFFDNCERSFVREIIYLGDPDSLSFTKLMANRLRDNGILCISADGTRGKKFISFPFLGNSFSFPTGIVSLAKFMGSPILPLFCFDAEDGNVCLVISPAVQISPDWQREVTSENGIRQFMTLLEFYVRKYPEQYRKWDYSLRGRQTPNSEASSEVRPNRGSVLYT
jgi:lauroyl/myristoyl acyltransferase